MLDFSGKANTSIHGLGEDDTATLRQRFFQKAKQVSRLRYRSLSTMPTKSVVSDLVESCFLLNYKITFTLFYPFIMPADPCTVLLLVSHNFYRYSYIFLLDRVFITQKGTLIDFSFFADTKLENSNVINFGAT